MIRLAYPLAFIGLVALLFGKTTVGYSCVIAMFMVIAIATVSAEVFEKKNVAVAVLVSAILVVAAIVGCFVYYTIRHS